ncbi:hypothetical protein WSK_1464 [Novosphingobium sp. Rr 2-17]|nr:hypothetical protein WSK_1464 [Novosphingobium sp. Rr 2-17]
MMVTGPQPRRRGGVIAAVVVIAVSLAIAFGLLRGGEETSLPVEQTSFAQPGQVVILRGTMPVLY